MAVGIHLPTTVSLTIASVIIIDVALLRGIVLFIRSARISISHRILTSLQLLMVASTFPEVPTASMVPMIPFVTTSIMYQSGFMRGPSVHTVSVTGVAHTHIAFGRLAVVTFVVALRH